MAGTQTIWVWGAREGISVRLRPEGSREVNRWASPKQGEWQEPRWDKRE